MGDRDNRARIVRKEALQPVDGLRVEVVGRLVEQQQVGTRQQQTAQRHTVDVRPRQHGYVGIVGRAAQRVHGDLDVAFETPCVGRGDPVFEHRLLLADLVVVSVGVGPLGHHLVVAVDDPMHLGDPVHHVALDVLRRIELWLLREIADSEAGREPRLAGVAVVETGHDLQQRRLSRAVVAEHTDLGAWIERQRNVLQHRLVGRVVTGELVGLIDEFVRHGGFEAIGGLC